MFEHRQLERGQRVRTVHGWVSSRDSRGEQLLESCVGASALIGMFDPIATVTELEQHVLQSALITIPAYLSYCDELVGCRIKEKAEGIDVWRGAYVSMFDGRSGRHTLLYENGFGGKPLVARVLATRTYRIHSREGARAKRARAAEAEAAKQQAAKAPKKTSFFSRRRSSLGSRVGQRVRG